MKIALPKGHDEFKRALELVHTLAGIYDPDTKTWEIADDTDPVLLGTFGLRRVAGADEQPALFDEAAMAAEGTR